MNPMVGNLEKLLAQGKDGALLRLLAFNARRLQHQPPSHGLQAAW